MAASRSSALERAARNEDSEVGLLLLLSAVSVALAAVMVGNGSRAFTGFQLPSLGALAPAIAEFAVGLLWLVVAVSVLRPVSALLRKYRPAIRRRRRAWNPAAEGERTDIAKLARDLVALYRGSYTWVTVAVALATAVSVTLLAGIAVMFLTGSGGVGDLAFGVFVYGFTLFAPAVLYLYVHRRWGRRLLKAKDAEKNLAELLGGPLGD